MDLLVDIILISVFVLTVVVCASRGFIKSVWWLLRAVLSLGTAFLFGERLADWIMDRFMLDKFTSIAEDAVKAIAKESNGVFDLSELFSSMPENFQALLARFGADATSLGGTYAGAEHASAGDVSAMAADIAHPVASVVSGALGYVVAFLVAFVLITVVGWVVKLVAELPGIRGVNHLLGGIFGVLCGFVYLWVICLAISAFVESGIAESESRALMELAGHSHLFRFFCGFSPLDYVNIDISGVVGSLG